MQTLAAFVKYGLIFDIKKYAIHDGPGIRTVVFFKGCPLRCLWCHNPEGQNCQAELVFRQSRCIGCDECSRSCRREAISPVGKSISLDREKCVACGVCSLACPSEALSLAGKRMSADEIIKEIEKDAAFYEESKGGVTFSGGEPLFQPVFLSALLDECRERSIHTVVDTCGFAQYGVIDGIRDKVDLFLYDLKIMDDKEHREFTGASNQRVLGNLRKLAEEGSSIVISFPIIPGINDDDENVTRTAEFVSSMPNISQVNLLPYHKAGIEKYKNLGKSYTLGRIEPPSSRKVESVKEKMEAYGLRVGVGGG